jgi:hypothetical protein
MKAKKKVTKVENFAIIQGFPSREVINTGLKK